MSSFGYKGSSRWRSEKKYLSFLQPCCDRVDRPFCCLSNYEHPTKFDALMHATWPEHMSERSQILFVKKFARYKGDGGNFIYLRDIKDYVLFNVLNDLSPTFVEFFWTLAVDRFLRALIIYFQFFLQIWDLVQYRTKNKHSLFRHRNSLIRENKWRQGLNDLRYIVAREYFAILDGQDDSAPFHHMGRFRERVKSSVKVDKFLYESLLRYARRVVEVALCKGKHPAIYITTSWCLLFQPIISTGWSSQAIIYIQGSLKKYLDEASLFCKHFGTILWSETLLVASLSNSIGPVDKSNLRKNWQISSSKKGVMLTVRGMKLEPFPSIVRCNELYFKNSGTVPLGILTDEMSRLFLPSEIYRIKNFRSGISDLDLECLEDPIRIRVITVKAPIARELYRFNRKPALKILGHGPNNFLKTTDQQTKLLQMMYLCSESCLAACNLRVGILGLKRSAFDVMFNPIPGALKITSLEKLCAESKETITPPLYEGQPQGCELSNFVYCDYKKNDIIDKWKQNLAANKRIKKMNSS